MSNSQDCFLSLHPQPRHLRKVDEEEEGDVGEMVYVNVHDYLRVKGKGDIYRKGLYIL